MKGIYKIFWLNLNDAPQITILVLIKDDPSKLKEKIEEIKKVGDIKNIEIEPDFEIISE